MPIIGNGDIASILTDRPDVTYFVSGVSNSKCTDEKEFEREKKLLLAQGWNLHLVYVSTLAIYYGDSMYVQHKKRMERLIKENYPSYTIIRIGNITWGKNPNTLINYLKAHPEAEAQQVYRYIVDKEEFLHWVNMAPVGMKNEMNITGRMVWVPDLLASIRAENVKKIYAHGPSL